MRYAGQKRRTTTKKTYAMNIDYKKCLKEAKTIHRDDKAFYLYDVGNCYSSISVSEFDCNDLFKSTPSLEYWVFDDRWEKKIAP